MNEEVKNKLERIEILKDVYLEMSKDCSENMKQVDTQDLKAFYNRSKLRYLAKIDVLDEVIRILKYDY